MIYLATTSTMILTTNWWGWWRSLDRNGSEVKNTSNRIFACPGQSHKCSPDKIR